VAAPWESPADQESARLVAAHLAGDRRAFDQIVLRYRGRLVRFVARMIGDEERAQDLVQEAFLRVHRHIHRFDPTRKFSTWIYTIASNLAKNEIRNRRRSPLVYYQALEPLAEEDRRPLQFEDSTSRPDVLLLRRHLRELVDATVAKLAPRHRDVFVLREIEGRSYAEIARRTGCNIGTVKSRLNRARGSFAEMIAPHLD